MTIYDFLQKAAAESGSRDAVVWNDWSLTYEELHNRVLKLASRLQETLSEGERIGIVMPNRGEFVEIYVAGAHAGAICVPLNFRFTAEEMAYVLKDCGVSAVIYDGIYESVLRDALHIAGVVDVPLFRVGNAGGSLDAVDYETWLSNATGKVDCSAEDTAFFIGYTSGTTGFPKGCLIRQSSMLQNMDLFAQYYGGASRSDRFLTLMPMFHTNSTMFAVYSIFNQMPNVIFDSGGATGTRIMEAIDKNAITLTSLVPTILTSMLDATRLNPDVSGTSLRALLIGSAPMTVDLKMTARKELGVDLFETYGSTELGLTTTLLPDQLLSHADSVGRVVPGKELEIRDEELKVLPPGVPGDIWVRGEGIMLDSYWGRPEDTMNTKDEHGWLSVGDVGFLDHGGFLHLVDRKNDMIISGGENIYPTEVENALLSHPDVEQAAVVGLEDEKWGECVYAVVVPVAGTCPEEEDILRVAALKLARYKMPRKIYFWSALPATPMGKIQRRRIRIKLATGAGPDFALSDANV